MEAKEHKRGRWLEAIFWAFVGVCVLTAVGTLTHALPALDAALISAMLLLLVGAAAIR